MLVLVWKIINRKNILFFHRTIIFIIYDFISVFRCFARIAYSGPCKSHNQLCSRESIMKILPGFLVKPINSSWFHLTVQVSMTTYDIFIYSYFKHAWQIILILGVFIQLNICWSIFYIQPFSICQYIFFNLLLDKASS